MSTCTVRDTIPALQCLRHALHCNFGSTSIISHSSVFPAAIIASFDFAEGIERTMLLKITLKCFSLRMTFDFLNQVMNANALRSFHHRIWHSGDVEINVLVIHRKVELIRVITIFETTIFLQFVQSSLPQVPPFDRDFSGCVFSSSFTGCPVRS